MKGKYVVFFSVISVLLMVSVPCVSAIEYDATQFNQEKKPGSFISKLKEAMTSGCIYTRMLLVLYIIYGVGIVTAIATLHEKPLAYGISRTGMYYLFLNCYMQIGKLAGYDGEPLWCTPEGWAQLTAEEKKVGMTLPILHIIRYTIKLKLMKNIVGR